MPPGRPTGHNVIRKETSLSRPVPVLLSGPHIPHGPFPSRAGPPVCALSPLASESPRTNPPHASAADDVHRRGRRRRLPQLRRIRHARRPRQGPRSLLQGAGCLLRVRREARGQEAHRDRHHGAPLPRRLQEVPRQLRQQLPPHLGEALRPAVLRQEAGAEAARRRRGPPGPHLASPALHLQAIGSSTGFVFCIELN